MIKFLIIKQNSYLQLIEMVSVGRRAISNWHQKKSYEIQLFLRMALPVNGAETDHPSATRHFFELCRTPEGWFVGLRRKAEDYGGAITSAFIAHRQPKVMKIDR